MPLHGHNIVTEVKTEPAIPPGQNLLKLLLAVIYVAALKFICPSDVRVENSQVTCASNEL